MPHSSYYHASKCIIPNNADRCENLAACFKTLVVCFAKIYNTGIVRSFSWSRLRRNTLATAPQLRVIQRLKILLLRKNGKTPLFRSRRIPLFQFGDLLFYVRYAIISAISTVREGILLMRGKVPVLVAGSDSRRFLFVGRL